MQYGAEADFNPLTTCNATWVYAPRLKKEAGGVKYLWGVFNSPSRSSVHHRPQLIKALDIQQGLAQGLQLFLWQASQCLFQIV